MITLRSPYGEAVVLPHVGGAIGAFRVEGVDIMRPTPNDLPPAGANDPLETACFPLLPYANRIAHGQFEWQGRRYTLLPNFGDHPHVLHGTGWHAHWRVEEQTDSSVLLIHDHDGGAGWPWAYRAEQHVALIDRRLDLRLQIENRSGQQMPAGLGFHPYFPLRTGTTVRFDAGPMWLTEDDLPVEAVATTHFGNWPVGASLAGDQLIDNAFGHWGGSADIMADIMDAAAPTVSLTATNADWLHLFRPVDGDFFCLEPVTHMPDALNRGGMRSLAPGETLAITMSIAAGEKA